MAVGAGAGGAATDADAPAAVPTRAGDAAAVDGAAGAPTLGCAVGGDEVSAFPGGAGADVEPERLSDPAAAGASRPGAASPDGTAATVPLPMSGRVVPRGVGTDAEELSATRVPQPAPATARHTAVTSGTARRRARPTLWRSSISSPSDGPGRSGHRSVLLSSLNRSRAGKSPVPPTEVQ